MRARAIIYGLTLLALAAGCEKRATREPLTGPWKPTMVNPPIRELPVCEPKDINQLKDEDILLSVNGMALTKGDFGLAMKRYWWSLEQDKMKKPEVRTREYKLYGKQYLGNFLSSQLLATAARRQGLIPKSNLVARVEAGVKRSARQYKMPLKVLDRVVPGGLDGIRRTLEDLCWASDYVASNVTPRVMVVDDTMVSNALAQVEAENAAAEQTNKVRRASMATLRKRLVEGGADFGELADMYCMDESQRKGVGGYWKTFRTSIEQDPIVVEKIYPLPVGGVSEVLEDDEGYYLVKVLKIEQLPMPTNRVPKGYKPPKDYDLGRIFLPKEELTTLAAPGEIKHEFQQQFQQAELKKELEKLAAEATIVYPYGTNLFSQTTSQVKKNAVKKKLSKKERRAMREAKIVKKALAAGEDPKDALKKAKKSWQKAKRRKAAESAGENDAKKADEKGAKKASEKGAKKAGEKGAKKAGEKGAKKAGEKGAKRAGEKGTKKAGETKVQESKGTDTLKRKENK